MHIISLGSDKSVLDTQSPLAARVRAYAQLVEHYTVLVPAAEDTRVQLSPAAEAVGIGGEYKLLQALELYGATLKHIKKTQDTVVLTVQDPYIFGLLGVLLSWRTGVPLEVQVHGFEMQGWWRRMLCGFVLKRARHIRVVSERLKKEIVQRLSIPAQHMSVVPIGLDSSWVCEPALHHKEGPFHFVTAGRLVPVKAIDAQLQALAEVKKQGKLVQLTIIGEGPQRRALETLAKALDIESAIRFVGWKDQKEIQEIYRTADAFLFTSTAEGWGLAPVEAAAAGLPVLMTDVGCAGELFVPAQHAHIVPTGDENALVAGVLRIMSDPEYRQALAQAGHDVVQSLPNQGERLKKYLQGWKAAAYPRLLVLTQKVDKDDDVLGFFHGWLTAFAAHFPSVEVIALGVGAQSLPKNVHVYSLGKEERKSRMIYVLRFFSHVWRLRHHYDVVLVHMNKEYVTLGFWLWWLLRKPVFLWYNHKFADTWAKFAMRRAKKVFYTSSGAYAARLAHSVQMPVGVEQRAQVSAPEASETLRLLSLGRISPVKDIASMIRAVRILKDKGTAVHLDVYGAAVDREEDQAYEKQLHALVDELALQDAVQFHGAVAHKEIARCFLHADLFLNMTPSGSLDKTLLEAAASGVPIVTCNESFTELLDSRFGSVVHCGVGQAKSLAECIVAVNEFSPEKRRAYCEALLTLAKQHGIEALVRKIKEEIAYVV